MAGEIEKWEVRWRLDEFRWVMEVRYTTTEQIIHRTTRISSTYRREIGRTAQLNMVTAKGGGDPEIFASQITSVRPYLLLGTPDFGGGGCTLPQP